MRSFYFITILLLTACTANSAAQTFTPTLTPTIPVLTSTSAPTETPTITPTPTEIPLPETDAVKALQEAYTAEGKGYQVGWNKEGTGLAIIWVNPENPEEKKIVPEIVINPEDGSAVRTYMCETAESGKFEVTTNYTAEEIKTKTFSAWEVKDGELVRKDKKFPGLVKPEEGPTFPLYSTEEINAELALSSTIATDEEKIVSSEKSKHFSNEVLFKQYYNNHPYFTYKGMLIRMYGVSSNGDNILEAKDKETGEIVTIDTSFYKVYPVGSDSDNFGLVCWRVNGADVVRVADKKNLNKMNNFNSYFEKNEAKL